MFKAISNDIFSSAFRNDSSNTQNKPSNAADEWTTVLRRQDGSVEFFRNWTEYKNGFGDPPNGELFLGLEKLHQLTSATPQELMIELEDWDNVKRTARYDHFVVGSEDEKYSLKNLGKYSGNAGDSLRLHLGMSFTTKDADNDHRSDGNCALWFKGGWWYNNCIYRR